MTRLLALLVLAVALAWGGPVGAAPKAELWARWQQHDPAATTTVDHTAWGLLLDRFVRAGKDGIHRFAYREVTPQDRGALDAYLAMLAAVPVSRLDRPEQLAYWLNLYNALTVAVVLDHYPTRSIRDIDISPGLFSDGPWRLKLVTVEGEALSLDDIEHRIVRPIWHDPRIHYGLNCAAIGCPNLQPRPFSGHDLDHALDLAAMAYVNDPRGMRIEDGHLHVSSIYVWFMDDFGGDEAGVIRHLLAYAEPEAAMRLQRLDAVDSHSYDWRLNDAG
jgi:hypothetical protein